MHRFHLRALLLCIEIKNYNKKHTILLEIEFRTKKNIQERKKQTFLKGLPCAWEEALIYILYFGINTNT